MGKLQFSSWTWYIHELELVGLSFYRHLSNVFS